MVLAALDRLNFLGWVFFSDITILILTTAQLQRGGELLMEDKQLIFALANSRTGWFFQ
jgi:hypothetical protein